MIGVLGTLLKNQTGESVSNERVAQLLLANMATLVKQGKLTQQQILQVLWKLLSLLVRAKSLWFYRYGAAAKAVC